MQERTRGAHGFGWTWTGVAAFALAEVGPATTFATNHDKPCRVMQCINMWEDPGTEEWEAQQGPGDAATCPVCKGAMVYADRVWHCPGCDTRWPS